MAFLDGKARSADVLAEEDCEVLRLNYRDFLEFQGKMPEAALKILQNIAIMLSFNLRVASEELRAFEEGRHIDNPEEFLGVSFEAGAE